MGLALNCCILTFDRAVSQGFLYIGCTCVNKWKQMCELTARRINQKCVSVVMWNHICNHPWQIHSVSLSLGSQEVRRTPVSGRQAPPAEKRNCLLELWIWKHSMANKLRVNIAVLHVSLSPCLSLSNLHQLQANTRNKETYIFVKQVIWFLPLS